MKLKSIKNFNGFTQHHFYRNGKPSTILSRENGAGFTLVEMLVAISMITVTFVPIILMFSSSISLSIYAKNRITANFLAQEAFEFIRNERTNNFINVVEGGSALWTDGFSNCTFPDGCTIDVFSKDINTCSGTCPQITYTDIGNERKYGQDLSGIESGFTRKVSIAGGSPTIALIIDVSWNDGGRARNEQFYELLYEWGP